MVDREVKAHRLVDHPNVMPLIDYEIVRKGENTEARMLFPFYQVSDLEMRYLLFDAVLCIFCENTSASGRP